MLFKTAHKKLLPLMIKIDNICIERMHTIKFKVVGAATVSDDFFLHNRLRNIELNVDTTNNHLALTSYFANPSLKKQF